MRLALLASVGLLTACGAAGTDVGTTPSAVVAETAAVTVPETCGMVFSLPAELADAGASAAARWSAATGCDVRVAAEGLPVVILDTVLRFDGRATKARTVAFGGVMSHIEVRSDSIHQAELLLTHEMGHALGAEHHSETGAMREWPAVGIDAASLAEVCGALECETFVPEM